VVSDSKHKKLVAGNFQLNIIEDGLILGSTQKP